MSAIQFRCALFISGLNQTGVFAHSCHVIEYYSCVICVIPTIICYSLIILNLFKYAALGVENLRNLESCLFVLFPYFSYMLAEGFGLSGIVSILFTGIVMKRYTFSNLSEDSQRFTAAFFHLLSSLAETFVFIYMGFDIAMERESWSHIGFIFFSIIFILIARAANVFSCAYLLNLAWPPHRQISRQYQQALWYSGLRGAMAFALALQSVHDLPEGHGRTILSATISIVVLTDQENFDGNIVGNKEQHIEEGTSTASRFKLKLRDPEKHSLLHHIGQKLP